MMPPRRHPKLTLITKVGLWLSLLFAIIGTAAWIYGRTYLGDRVITIAPDPFASGRLYATINSDRLLMGRRVSYCGTRPYEDWRIGLPCLFEFSYGITDGGFFSGSGMKVLFEAWDMALYPGALIAVAGIYPAFIFARFRRFLKWTGLILSMICFCLMLKLLVQAAQEPDTHWTDQFFEQFMHLLLISAPSAFLFACDLKAAGIRSENCRACGYNLTGNVSGVCPECGEAIPSDQQLTLRDESRLATSPLC